MEDKEKKNEDFKSREEELDAKTKDANEKFGIDEDIEVKEEKVDAIEAREAEIELRLQEIDIEMDKLDIALSINDEDIDAMEKYNELKKEAKELLKEKRLLRKETYVIEKDPTVKSLNDLSVWIIIYGIFACLFSSPLLSSVWVDFAGMIIRATSDTIGAMDPSTTLGKIVVILLIFAFPLVLHIVSWVLYLNLVKSKTNKFAFRIAWIAQAVCTLITMTIALVNVFK